MPSLAHACNTLCCSSLPTSAGPGHHQVYGGYYRKLSKKAQAALAEANAVAEEVLSAQPTVSLRCIETHTPSSAPEHQVQAKCSARPDCYKRATCSHLPAAWPCHGIVLFINYTFAPG